MVKRESGLESSPVANDCCRNGVLRRRWKVRVCATSSHKHTSQWQPTIGPVPGAKLRVTSIAASRTPLSDDNLEVLSRLKRLFRRRGDAPEGQAGAAQLLEWLRAILESHGVAAVPIDGARYIAAGGLAIGVEVFNEGRTSTGWSCQVDVLVIVADGRVLIESFSGIGATRAEMLRDAFESFAGSSFHVILRGLIKNERDDQVDIERWQVSGVQYDAFIGGVTSRGTPPGGRPPTAWFETFEKVVRSAHLSGDVHWIRLYYAQMNHKTMAVEVLLDNEPWETVAREMAAVAWPHVEEFYSARFFMILLRVTS